jgi:NADH dehydrogenase
MATANMDKQVTAKRACVFGGTGFIGRQIVRALAKQGYTVKIATRVPERAYFLRTAGQPGQIVPFACSTFSEPDVRAAVRGCSVVVNCVGILFERGKSSFPKIHTELPRTIAKACNAEKISRFVHISAMACDTNHSKYGKSKRNGELAVFENFPSATILRPSVVFGAEDNFFNMFAKLAVIAPVLPLIGGGHTKFCPVFVGDIADAVMASLDRDESKGKIYDLGGPETVTFREIYQRLFTHTGRRRALMPVPFGLAKVQAAFLSLMPVPLLTPDQVESLKTDNVPGDDTLKFGDLGIRPTPMDMILPTYLSRFRPGGRFGDKKRA